MNNSPLSPWDRFFNLLKLERKDIFQIFYYALFSGIVALSLPLGIQAIINLIQGAEISSSWIVLIVLVTLGAVFNGLLQLMQLRIIETMQQRIFTRSSFELTYRFPKMAMEELRNYYPPELANRFFDNLTIQKGLTKILIDVPAALLQVIFALLLLSFYHPLFIAYGLVLLGGVYIVFKYSIQKGVSTSLEESKYKYKVAHWIQEVARSVVSFKLSGKTNLALHKNDLLVDKYLNAREKHFGVIKSQYIKMIVFKALITAGLLSIGGLLVLGQQMNIGQFVAAEIIILLVIASIEKLIIGLETLYDMLTSIEKLGQVVDKPLESRTGEIVDLKERLKIELDHLSYSVPNREKPILSDINLRIEKKNILLIQGESGSGKSTLLRILAGLIKPTKGSLFVNQLNSQGILINHYRAQLGLSLSEEYPFEGSLRENLTFNDRSITDDQIYKVMEKVGLLDFLTELPHGLNTEINPEGRQISYTNSKKIILARAILKSPQLLILEDALDQFSQSETKEIIDYLTNPQHPWSLVVVSSNDYWKNFATQVIKLTKGKLV
ncbi:MAG: ATP-binding cassette domain-containing protein [Flavobacteriaceae bacterium]|jgi:ABC-type bacteriocin/lantibiotic exporter with double-glycine peptidase domain|nr:ATP-binding cassette domain-containing protein [Flavobacteriaceae bacterium]NVJ73186.1 ATP-binding cassette domain-containing protein [Flavobacteriaceae bacterium]